MKERRRTTPRIRRRNAKDLFRDLGFSGEEAENLRIRAELMVQLTKLIGKRGLTQAKAARLFGVSQPRLSDLVRGRTDRLSIDSLVEMLGHAGSKVLLPVTP